MKEVRKVGFVSDKDKIRIFTRDKIWIKMGLKYDCWINFSQNPLCYTFLKKRTFFEFCVVASLEKQFEGSTESGFRFRQNAAQILHYIYQGQ